ncbi:MAG: hypothetical protein A2286_00355 [Gammaproteobacteria bacterium RIFOXYA12_FULL_61_12]|nr:MAG: hypothetical protein A2514_11335 [Gammaproteobacteria bacterium RIFOXYD12_FULL_61_37]OGT94043.1 MAG: hypothetical protein A2286_00355 [Gammaproteobacteria bacterium RIFOXYA12_FULL_61_12]
MRHNAITWGDFRFPGLNLWNAPPSPEMLSLYREMAEGKGQGTDTPRTRLMRAEAQKRLAQSDTQQQDDRFRLLLAHH